MALIKFQKPALFRKDMDAVLQTMVDEKIGPGEKKKAFTQSFSDYLHTKSTLALRSYVDAISLSLSSLNLEEGDRVALSVYTNEVYLKVLSSLHLKPLYIDGDENGMLSVKDLEKKMENNPKAIIYYEPVCQIPENTDEIKDFALPIIEDISQSLGSSRGFIEENNDDANNIIKPGMIGKIVIAATEEDAIVSTGGGALLSSRDEDLISEIEKKIDDYSQYVEMSDLNASLGLVQLMKIDSVVSKNNALYKKYIQSVMKGEGKVFGSVSPDFTFNGYGFSVVVNSSPDEMISFALKYGVSAKRTFIHSVGNRFRDKFDEYPVSIPSLSRAISFPIYPFLLSSEVDTITKVLSHLR